jgi:hypothetical protein
MMVNRPKDTTYYLVREKQFTKWYHKMLDVGADWSRPTTCAWQAWISAWDTASYLICPHCEGIGEVDSGAPDPQGNFIMVDCPHCEDGLLIPSYDLEIVEEGIVDKGAARRVLSDFLTWLDIEISEHEQWIDHLREQNRPQDAIPYEGSRAGMAECRDWICKHWKE